MPHRTEKLYPSEEGALSWLDFALLVWVGLLLALNYPGHLSLDSLVQIAEGQSGNFESWNPQFISIIFGQLARWAKTPAVLVLISAIVVCWSLRSIVLAGGPLRPSSVLVLIALLFAPVLLIYPAIVWKDVWFAHACLAAFALMVNPPADGDRVFLRTLIRRLLVLLLLAVAMLSRQTGVLVALLAAISMAQYLPWIKGLGRRMGTSVNASINLGLVLALAALLYSGSQALVRSSPGEPVQGGVKFVATYDIAGILHRVPDASLARFDAARIDTGAMRTAALQTYQSDRIDTLQWPQSHEFVHLPKRELYLQWWDLVSQNPAAYLQHRLSTFSWFLGLRDQSKCVPVFLGFGPPELVKAAGITQQPTSHFSSLYRYAQHFFDTPYFAPGAWGLVSLLILIVLVRCGWGRHPVAWLQVAGLSYLASYFPVGLACDFRYAYFSTLAAHAGIVFLVAAWPTLRSGPMPPRTKPLPAQ